ncbi:MAG: exo-alpha-sialidase [Phycisphaeraceae bacterium]|nr:exo-alpha-sialidase [Phycisphaeraceae bacterium]
MTALAAAALADNPAVLSSQFIYEQAPFPQCHASTIVSTETGLVAAWFGGTKEKDPDVCIWVSRKAPDAEAWTEPVNVADGVQYVDADGVEQRYPCWNPVLFAPKPGVLLLFYKVGPDPRQWWGMQMLSKDGGATWSPSRRLPEGILGPVKNKPILLSNGAMLCPTSKEDDGWKVYLERSGDMGRTWHRVGPLASEQPIEAIQPSILTHADGRLQIICRTKQGKLAESWSSDQGKSWQPLRLMELPNPNAGTDAVTLADGRQLLVYNPQSKGRSPLAVAISVDGVDWKQVLVLEDEPDMEFSYPAVIQDSQGKVHVTYTWKRQRIRHVVIDPTLLSH